MIYVFERETVERIYVKADDEDAAREKLDNLCQSEWVIVSENAPELIRIEPKD